ncbi:MAG: amino acid ABC transporter ATP-binding protein [Clostridia bacterium]|nr:amino acid ABC transporter ATP-binding protein [Clostridia bacterium]
MAYLQIDNFYKSFGETDVLKGINLSLEQGKVLTIIGPSGSGKTTLLRCINFLDTVNKGTMSLDGELLLDAGSTKDDETVLRNKRLNFGLVFQSFNLFPQYNVLDNVTLAPKLLLEDELKQYKRQLKKQGMGFVAIRQKMAQYKANQLDKINQEAVQLLSNTGLLDKKASYPCELSGGQCQRVAIARALALKPKILCFDEPTSALDPELTGEVLRVIRSLKDEGRTMIIVTHEMDFAKNVSDEVVFMCDGVVEESGKPEQMFGCPKSDKLQAFLRGISNKE